MTDRELLITTFDTLGIKRKYFMMFCEIDLEDPDGYYIYDLAPTFGSFVLLIKNKNQIRWMFDDNGKFVNLKT